MWTETRTDVSPKIGFRLRLAANLWKPFTLSRHSQRATFWTTMNLWAVLQCHGVELSVSVICLYGSARRLGQRLWDLHASIAGPIKGSVNPQAPWSSQITTWGQTAPPKNAKPPPRPVFNLSANDIEQVGMWRRNLDAQYQHQSIQTVSLLQSQLAMPT